MEQTVFVIPKKGLIVRDPISKNELPEGGGNVPFNSYWQRRLKDGDVSLKTETKPKTVYGGEK